MNGIIIIAIILLLWIAIGLLVGIPMGKRLKSRSERYGPPPMK